jgi:hypothetical protein
LEKKYNFAMKTAIFMKKFFSNATNFSLGLVFIVALSRLVPHPWNFSPLGAISVFAGAAVLSFTRAVSGVLLCVFFSDLLVNNILYRNSGEPFIWFYPGFYWVYASYVVIVFLSSRWVRPMRWFRILSFVPVSSLVFYLISNFGVWVEGTLYPHTFSGLVSCYVAALPFLKGTLAGDLIYSVILFGIYQWYFSRKGTAVVSE